MTEAALLTIDLAIVKTSKWAIRESGDTAEIVERPGGGLSVVLVDGQGSGAGAKMLSNALAGKAITLLKDGARDGVVARAAHDYLHHYRFGRVSATLDILSVDLVSRTVVATRNSHCPLLVCDADGVHTITPASGAIGPYRHTRPDVLELPVRPGTRLVIFTDGILTAGERYGTPFVVTDLLARCGNSNCSAADIADAILNAAIEADHGRPHDDMAVVVVSIHEDASEKSTLIRRLAVSLPLDSLMGKRP